MMVTNTRLFPGQWERELNPGATNLGLQGVSAPSSSGWWADFLPQNVGTVSKLKLVSLNIGVNSTVYGGIFNILRREKPHLIFLQEVAADQDKLQELVKQLVYSICKLEHVSRVLTFVSTLLTFVSIAY